MIRTVNLISIEKKTGRCSTELRHGLRYYLGINHNMVVSAMEGV
jgi:hypothetical protein